VEGFALGSYLQLVDNTARLYRAGKAAVSREVAAILDRLGSTAEERQARLKSCGRAVFWAVISRPPGTDCGRSPSVWASNGCRTWVAAGLRDVICHLSFVPCLLLLKPSGNDRAGGASKNRPGGRRTRKPPARMSCMPSQDLRKTARTWWRISPRPVVPTSLSGNRWIWKLSFAGINKRVHDSASLAWSVSFETDLSLSVGSTAKAVVTDAATASAATASEEPRTKSDAATMKSDAATMKSDAATMMTASAATASEEPRTKSDTATMSQNRI